MNKIIATIVKEWQLMRRDVSGMLLLLIMPAALIIVMALIQDAPFKDYRQFRFDLLVSDNDHGGLARQIDNGLKQSSSFHVIDSINGQPVTADQLTHLLETGRYTVGIIIPAGVSAELVNSANIVANRLSEKTGMSAHLPYREVRPTNIHLYFDPVSKPVYRATISLALDKYISYSCSEILMQRLAKLGNNSSSAADTSNEQNLRKIMQGITIKEESTDKQDTIMKHINSVQHNVPAWAIFGMFFIVVPIAGHTIKEREEGSALRVKLVPGVGHYVTLGKIILYAIVCTIQFLLMMCIGLWIMPLFHLPALYPGAHAWLLLPVAACISFAATAYGFLIGVIFKTINQALPFASVSIVMLSAIGGIWVPIEVMPHSMQTLAIISPLHWSLEAVNQVILRNGNVEDVLLPSFVLIVIGTLFWALSAFVYNRRRFA